MKLKNLDLLKMALFEIFNPVRVLYQKEMPGANDLFQFNLIKLSSSPGKG